MADEERLTDEERELLADRAAQARTIVRNPDRINKVCRHRRALPDQSCAARASHVVVVDPAPSKKTWAPRFGATEVYDNFAEADAFIKSITDGQGADSAIVSIGVVKNEHIGQAFGAIRKAGTVVVVGVSNEREGAPVPGFNAITVAMFQQCIQGSLYGMARPAMRCPTC
jgi:Zn-dependent alcohol dehydrogenase